MGGNRRIYPVLCALLALSATASLAGLEFGAELTTAQELPAPAPGDITTSDIDVRFDGGMTQARVKLRIRGGSAVAAAHFHCGLPGRNGPVAVDLLPAPLIVHGDTAEGIVTIAHFRAVDCVPHIGRPVNTIAALAFAMREGLIYANVHTPVNPAGEVRGQLLEFEKSGKSVVQSVPEEPENEGVPTGGRVHLDGWR